MKDKDDKIKIFSGFRVNDKFKHGFEHFQQQHIHLTDLRWTPFKQLHLTLWFYGEVSKNLTNNILAMNELLKNQMGKINLTFDKIKVAPNNQKGRMIWAVYHPNKEYKDWIKLHDQFLTKLNLGEREYKQIRPHITLARFKETTYQNKDINTTNQYFPPTLNLKELFVWESVTNNQNKSYNELKSYYLI